MELYDVVTAAGKVLNRSLVLHRLIKVHPKFKIYKVYEYNLYSLDSGEKELIFSHKFTINTTADDMLETWDKCDKDYLEIFFRWLKEYGFSVQ